MCEGRECDDAARDFRVAVVVDSMIVLSTLGLAVFLGVQVADLLANSIAGANVDGTREAGKQVVAALGSLATAGSIAAFYRSIHRAFQFWNALSDIRREQRLGPEATAWLCPQVRELRKKVIA